MSRCTGLETSLRDTRVYYSSCAVNSVDTLTDISYVKLRWCADVDDSVDMLTSRCQKLTSISRDHVDVNFQVAMTWTKCGNSQLRFSF